MMKSTLGMNYRMLSTNLENMSNRLYDLRQKAATGKDMNRPSDEPSAIRPVLTYRTRIASTGRYLDQMSAALGEMEVLDSGLDQIENIMVTAKETCIASMSDAANDADRDTYADRIGQLFDEMLQAANEQTGGKYIFAGYRETTRPFSVNPLYDPENTPYDPTDESTWAVHYNGDENAKTLEISPGKRIETALTGNDLFLGDTDNDGQGDAQGADVFSVLKNLEHAIRENDKAAMDDGLDKIDQGADQIRRLRGRMGNNAWRLERAGRHLESAVAEFEKIISGYEDADILDVFSRLVQQETAFEAALNVTSRISKLSILDFM